MRTNKTAAASHMGRSSLKGNGDSAPRIHARPSVGDPDQLQEFPEADDLPDLDNETVHKTRRPEGAILADDDLDDEAAAEHWEARTEDVSEGNPLHVGHP